MSSGRKTYWHLGGARRLPSDYEVATSRLLYYVERGGLPAHATAAAFYARHQAGSALVCGRWEDFADPRATTYTKYVGLAREREVFVGRLLASIEESDHDAALPAAWVDRLVAVLSPLRYLGHALQMLSAYVGQMAPSGRITVAALFQAADEVRRVERVAHRLAQLQRLRPQAAEEGRRRWEADPAWQPLRRAIEKLLVTYDWGEAFVVVNTCCKPLLDEIYMIELGALAEAEGDALDAEILRSLHEDCRWHRSWSEELLRLALEDRPQNREVVAGWMRAWTPLVDEAAAAARRTLEGRHG